jgi:hypothetical protein
MWDRAREMQQYYIASEE